MAIMVTLIFVSLVFIQCSHNSIAGAYNDKLVRPYCSRSCVCEQDLKFMPVCPQESVQTYYSPCHAGCLSESLANGQRVS